MQLTYFGKPKTKPRVTLIGLIAVGISAILICVPAVAILASNWMQITLKQDEIVRRIAYSKFELPQIYNATLLILALAGLGAACVGVLLSRAKCIASVSAGIFNATIVVLIMTHNF